MDAKRKKTLEDFMVAIPEEELIAEKPSDTITLDEPKRNLWVTVFIYGVVLVILGGVAYTGYRVYSCDTKIKAEEKIEGSIVAETKESAETTEAVTVTPKSVYVNSEGGLNLRQTAATTAAVLIIIPDKTKLTVEEEKSGWLKVTYSGKTGWCSKDLTTIP